MSDRQLTPPPTRRFGHLIKEPPHQVGALHVPLPSVERKVQAHALLHRSVDRLKTPRAFLMQGPPGSGKSQLIANSLLRMTPPTCVLIAPPSLFGSKHEGGAVENCTELMSDAASYSRERRRHIAVLIEDIDTSIMNITENLTGHTTATRELVGYLQFLAEHRDIHVDFEGNCIAIYCTANSAGEMRESLFRDMRASVYTHLADAKMKLEVAYSYFQPQGAEERAIIDRLFKAHKDEMLVFWPALHHDYMAARTESVIATAGTNIAEINKALATRRPLDERLLTELARKHRAEKPGIFFRRKR